MADDEPSDNDLCTRAVTGAEHPAHQAIYICDTCLLLNAEDEPLPACICQSCAYSCHAGHEVYYVGVGQCTCDCPSLAVMGEGMTAHECRLAARSEEEAQRLGFGKHRPLNHPIPLKVPPSLSEIKKDKGVVENNELNDEDGNTNKDEGNSNLCIGCNSSMGGYTYASFTLPGLLNNNGGEICHDLIRQAEALIECSRDTFWIPDDESKDDANDDNEWCDLEILARQIYRQHVQSYDLQKETEKDDDTDETNSNPMSGGGAEWWVQVKPTGTPRAPVDLHYDKDEVLAESFGLGSFPTLSTVTYLTGENDNVPTVIFPHTYHDEEDQPIESMLLSHAARAKHIVFDGRLLHGAPAHPSLLRCRKDASEKSKEVHVSADADGESSLRVTFLVNIWASGRPAGVHILPDDIRRKIQLSASELQSLQRVMPLEFQKREVSNHMVTAKASEWPSAVNGEDDKKDEKIILPFVSKGATWIGEDGEDTGDGDVVGREEGRSIEDEPLEGDSSTTVPDEENEEDYDEEDDDELVLVLSPFTTAAYLEDKSDTMLISFEGGSRARLVREGALEDEVDEGCRWRKLIEKRSSEMKTAHASEFLSYLNEHVPPFVSSIVTGLNSECAIDVSNLQADHVCYRTDSIEQYTSLVEALRSDDSFKLLVESEIGGRPIATFKLATPIEIKLANCDHSINVIEIPSPKEGSPYNAGLEHVEFAIGDGMYKSPMNDDSHQHALLSWMECYPSVSWNTKALHKKCNPDVSTKLDFADHGKVSVKFHLIPLEDVIEFEVQQSV